MPTTPQPPTRFVGLDIHKHYLVAVGVDATRTLVLGPQRVAYAHLTTWVQQHLTPTDAVVLEMTTNAFQLHDELQPVVHSVTLVHPPHVALVTQVPVKTDAKAALALAQLHAAGLLNGIWVPPPSVRDLRAVVAQRTKLRRLATGRPLGTAIASMPPSIGRGSCRPRATCLRLSSAAGGRACRFPPWNRRAFNRISPPSRLRRPKCTNSRMRSQRWRRRTIACPC